MTSEVGKKGLKIRPSTTAGEIRSKAGRLNSRRQVERFLEIYERHRFGAMTMSPDERKEYLSLLMEIKKL